MSHSTTAYENDFYAWTQQQAAALRRIAEERVNLDLDPDHLAEEIEDLGKSERDALESALIRIIEHLLKLEYSPAADRRAGWELSVVEHRLRLARKIEDSPSLESHLEKLFARAWRDARKLVARSLNQDGIEADILPEMCPYSLDQARDHDWWPVNRHVRNDG